MKTRTLILLAMACGLAILVAGGAFLWRVIANKDELTIPDPAGVGQTQQVGPVRATLLQYVLQGDQLDVTVRLESTEPLGDAGSGWALLVDGKLADPVTATDSSACAGKPVTVGQPVECTLAFQASDGDRYVAYATGAQQRLWRL